MRSGVMIIINALSQAIGRPGGSTHWAKAGAPTHHRPLRSIDKAKHRRCILDTCKATLACRERYSLCVGETTSEPWERHVERGSKADQSTVTAISADPPSRVGLDSSKAKRANQFRAENGGPSGREAIMVSARACEDHRRDAQQERRGRNSSGTRRFRIEILTRKKKKKERTFAQRVKAPCDLNLTPTALRCPPTGRHTRDRRQSAMVLITEIFLLGQSTLEAARRAVHESHPD